MEAVAVEDAEMVGITTFLRRQMLAQEEQAEVE
jgi:hypothetical protein